GCAAAAAGRVRRRRSGALRGCAPCGRVGRTCRSPMCATSRAKCCNTASCSATAARPKAWRLRCWSRRSPARSRRTRAEMRTSLLPAGAIARAARCVLLTRQRRTARGAGSHRATRGGRGLEFKDHRLYARGDDVRFLDWTLLARTHGPWLRVYHDEEEQDGVLLVDASASMRVEDKLLRARQLAALVGAMVLRAGDRVSVHAFGGGAPLRG